MKHLRRWEKKGGYEFNFINEDDEDSLLKSLVFNSSHETNSLHF